jgi:hypothetical protein
MLGSVEPMRKDPTGRRVLLTVTTSAVQSFGMFHDAEPSPYAT